MIHYHFELSKKRLRNTNEQYKNKELLNQYENVLKEELQGEIIQKVTLETDYHLIHYFLRYSVICNDEANTKLRVGFGASGALVLLYLVLRVNTVRYQSSRPFYLIFESTISGWISGAHSSFRVE